VGASLLVVGLTVACTSGSPSAGQPGKGSSGGGTAIEAVTSLELNELPPIAQPGNEDASPDDASTVLVASVHPAGEGAVVTLQRRNAAGWRNLGHSSTDGRGLATFEVPAPQGPDSSPDHRVVLDGRPEVRSDGVDDGWQLEFSDEFSGTRLGPDWSYRALGLLSPGSGRKVSASSRDAVQVRDGALHLQVRHDPTKAGHYLNGHVSTEKSYLFKYGVAAARIRFQRPRGTHGAFWSQSPTFGDPPGDPGAAGTEIDVGEYFGQGAARGGLASYVYHVDGSGSLVKTGKVLRKAPRLVGSADAFWKRYHVFSVEWSPEGYVFRIDGDTTYRTDKAVSARTQFLILSLLSSDWELPELDRSLLPATMSVDWVRVWQRWAD
jgi:beta-glucanase (GH16 family)